MAGMSLRPGPGGGKLPRDVSRPPDLHGPELSGPEPPGPELSGRLPAAP